MLRPTQRPLWEPELVKRLETGIASLSLTRYVPANYSPQLRLFRGELRAL